MNTNDNRDDKIEKTPFRFARRAAVLALPLGLLAATAAAPVQAAGGDRDVDVVPGAPPVNVGVPVNVPIASDGAEIKLADWEAEGKTYSTGALEGQVSLVETPENGGGRATDLILYSPIGEEGDLGQVRVTSVDPQAPEAGADDADAAKTYVIAFEIETLPGFQAPVTLQSAPFEVKAVTEATDVKTFPPVNQAYKLQEPVRLYLQQDAGTSSDPIGALEGFDVVVNQSS